MKLTVRKEFPYSKIGSWRHVNPYIMAFCYPKDGKPFLVKGGLRDVHSYLKGLTTPMVIHKTIWYHGRSRTYAHINNVGRLASCRGPIRRGDKNKYEIYHRDTGESILKLRRMPRSWIKELNEHLGGG